MKKHSPLWTVAFLLSVLIGGGCAVPESDFVHKTEEQLAEMEKCNDSAHAAFVSGDYLRAVKILDELSKEQTVSRPLYQMEKISVLLMDGRNDEAHELMKKVRVDLDTLFDKNLEEKAQSVWHGEVNKVFKGDSYERAALYTLMALSYIEKGNYEDAVRSVKNGLLIDADSNSADALDDFAILHYLGYFASLKMQEQEKAQEYVSAMKKAMEKRGFKYSEDKETLPLTDCFGRSLAQKSPNVLLVVWAGAPPSVVCSGQYNELRSIIRGNNTFDAMSAAVDVMAPFFVPNNLGDIEYQATTRGGRLMDNVLADKAAAKETMEISRNILLVAAPVLCMTGLRLLGTPPVGLSLLGAGIGCYVLGGTVHLIGSAMNPAADARYWRNLPAQFYIVPLTLPPGKHQVMMRGHRNADIAGMAVYSVDVPAGKDVSVFHLPMMSQGYGYSSAVSSRINPEIDNIISKAEADRLAKEIK